MQSVGRQSTADLLIVLALTGCMSAERKPATGANAASVQAYTGWYMEHGDQGSFQLCGAQSQLRRLSQAGELPARAKAFGLEPNTPLYVRVTGILRDNALAVASVEHSARPRRCAIAP